MGYGAGIGGLLGLGASFIPGIGVAAPLLAGAGSLLGGLFDGADTVNTAPYEDRARQLSKQAKEFYDPNSDFYRNATAAEKRTLMDMLLASVRQRERQLASQGINSSAISNELSKAAGVKAMEQANQFGQNLYRQGVGYGNQLNSQANSMYNLMASLQSGNAGISNSFSDQFMNIGAGLLGNYLGSYSNTTPSPQQLGLSNLTNPTPAFTPSPFSLGGR